MESAHQTMAQFLIPQYFDRSLSTEIIAIKELPREQWHSKIIQNICNCKDYFNEMLTKLGIPSSICILLQPLEKLVIPMIEVQFPLKPNSHENSNLNFMISSLLKSNMYQMQIFLRIVCIAIYFESRDQLQYKIVDYVERYEDDIEKGILFLQTQGPVDGFEFQRLISEIFDKISSRSQQFYTFIRDWCLERELDDCADQFRKKLQQLEKFDSENISQKQVEKPIPLSQETKENQNSFNFDEANLSRSQVFFSRPTKSTNQKININTFRSEMILGPTFDMSEKKIQKRTIMSVKDKQQKYKVPKSGDRERKSMTRSRIQVEQKPNPILQQQFCEQVSNKLIKLQQESQRRLWSDDVLAPPSDSD
ncbi:hypothetical protein pb186bvf_002478 [Paramecium bursaria]